MGAEQTNEVRRFVSPPGYTQIPNELLDEIMPAVTTLAELKVTLAIARETFGWQREKRRLSLEEIMELTGLSRQSAQKGVTACMERGYFGRRREGHGFVYGLRVATANNLVSSVSTEESTSLTQLSPDSRPPSNKGKKALRGKENNDGADAPPSAKKVTIKGKPGQTFKPDAEIQVHTVIVELYELWVAETKQPPRTTLTVGRAQQILARLREQAEGHPSTAALTAAREQLLEGLNGWFTSQWHRDRDAFDFEVFFRSRKKVEMFRSRGHRAQNGNGASNGFAAYEGVVERA